LLLLTLLVLLLASGLLVVAIPRLVGVVSLLAVSCSVRLALLLLGDRLVGVGIGVSACTIKNNEKNIVLSSYQKT